MPAVLGDVNDGSLDGGGWQLVRRTAPALGVGVGFDTLPERVLTFDGVPIGFGISSGGHVMCDGSDMVQI